MGFVAGSLGTGVGGLITLIIRNPSNRFFTFILGISGGLMISVVCFALLPNAFQIGLVIPILGIILGVVLINVADSILCGQIRNRHSSKNGFLKTGSLMGLSMATHNITEGLAIGSVFQITPTLGISLIIITMLHNIPEGMALATPLYLSGISRFKVVIFTFLVGLPLGMGTFLGNYIGNISSSLIGLFLGIASGGMLFITCQEIIPKSSALWKGRTSGFGIIFGIICGILLSKAF